MLAQPAHASVATRSSSFVYDPATGLVIKEIIEPGDPNLCLVTEYLYDDYGNKSSVTTRNCNGSAGEAAAPTGDAVIASRTDTSSYTYNTTDNTVTVVVSNAITQSETRKYEPGFGNLTSLTGPNNLTTSWQYDSFGRKHLETRADTTTTRWDYVIQTGTYAAQPNIAYYIATTVSGQVDASYDYYDMLGRKVLSEQRNFAGTDWIDQGNVVYDNLGRIVKSYLPYETSNFANAQYTTAIYDRLGRVASQTRLTENNRWVTSTVTYSGLTAVDQSPLGTKTNVRDYAGKVVSVTDAQSQTISYTYDPFGNLVTTTDPLSNAVVLTYDARGRKTGMSDPDMGIWSYAYDALGQLIRQVDAKNQTVSMTYDKLGRITGRNEPDLISTWTYDTAANGIGKVASVSSNNGYSRSYSYDTLGRASSTSSIIDIATPYVTSVSYDAYSRVDTQIYPTGFAVKNVYTADGYLSKVVNAATPTTVYWTANTMDAMGHLTQQTYGNGIVTSQMFYATGRLQRQLAGAGNAVQDTSYSYYDNGNLSQQVDAVNNLTETFSYDALNRIQTATATSGAINTINTYTYDAIGNMKTQDKKDVTANTYLYSYSYTYNASGLNSVQPHAISSVTTTVGSIYGVSNPVYTYDGNGSILTSAGRTVTWSSFNMPAAMTGCHPGVPTCSTISFMYNPDHERTKEVQADQSIVITLSPRYDTGLHFEKKYLAANGVLTGAVEYEHYLYAGGIMFGSYTTTTATDGVTVTSTSTEYYIKDHLGSFVARLDGTGAVIERLSYDTFGKRRYPNGANDPNGLLNNPDMYHGFTGHEMLDAVGYIHMNGRIYDPSIGKFLSADPTIQAPLDMQSYNRYTYGWNNPLSGIDPSGYSWFGDRWHALTGTAWSQSRGTVVTVVAAILDGMGWCGYCSEAAAGYNGYQSGGTMGAFIGIMGAYVGGQMGGLTGEEGNIIWGNVAASVMVNGAFGCMSAGAAGGDCERGFVTGAAGTVGGAFVGQSYGFVGAAVAGCAAGELTGSSCGEGAVNAVKVWGIMSAVAYVSESQRSVRPHRPLAFKSEDELNSYLKDGQVIIGARPLVNSGGIMIEGSSGGLIDKNNVEFLHEEVFYKEDGALGHRGFAPASEGGVHPDIGFPSNISSYRFELPFTANQPITTFLNSLLSMYPASSYNAIHHNCQDYCQAARNGLQ